MTVNDLYNKIIELVGNRTLDWDSPVTFHAYVRDGEAIEWKDDGITIECHSKTDGLEINVDTENTGIIYLDKYDKNDERLKVFEELSNFTDESGKPYFNKEFLKSKFINNSCG